MGTSLKYSTPLVATPSFAAKSMSSLSDWMYQAGFGHGHPLYVTSVRLIWSRLNTSAQEPTPAPPFSIQKLGWSTLAVPSSVL